MNLGRPPGVVVRTLLSPVGWPSLLILTIATIAIAATTRLQEGSIVGWRLRLHDLRFYWDLLRQRRDLLVWTDAAYVLGIGLLLLGTTWILGRCVVGLLMRRFLHGHDGRRLLSRRLVVSVIAILLIAGICVTVGWPTRIGTHWAAQRLNSTLPGMGTGSASLPDRDAQWALSAARRDGTPQRRLAAIAVLLEGFWDQGEPLRQLRDSLENDPDVTVRATALRLLGLMRVPEDIPTLTAALASPDPEIRTAAADGLSLAIDPRLTIWGIDVRSPWSPPEMRDFVIGRLRIRIHDILIAGPGKDVDGDGIADGNAPVPWPTDAVATLVRQMEHGTVASERQAAARALSIDPLPRDDVALAVTEWAVWQRAEKANFPGNKAAASAPTEERDRPSTDLIGWHLLRMRSQVPLVVQIDAEVGSGEIVYTSIPSDHPSVSYSKGFGPRAFLRQPSLLNSGNSPYAFLPGLTYTDSRGAADRVTSSGVAWRSLAVLPAEPGWRKSPPATAGTHWRDAMRQDDASWLAVGDTCEPFLHYRSNTRLPSPVTVQRSGDSIVVTPEEVGPPEAEPDYVSVVGIDPIDQTARRGRRTQRQGMHVRVDGDGVRVEVVPVPASGSHDGTDYRLGANAVAGGRPAGESILRQWVVEAGLSEVEGDNLLVAFRERFFATPGERFLVLLSAVDFDSRCPVQILPRPKTLTRVGLICTEWGE